MSQNVLIISPEEVKLNSRIEINADDKTLRDLVIVTQDTKLQGILGSTLYNSVVDAIYDFKVNSVALPSSIEDLIAYIKPYLKYQAVSDFIMVNHYKLTNKGTFKLNDDNATAANNSEIEWFRSYYDNTTASYKERLVKYISDNKLNTEKKVDTDFEYRGVYLDVSPSCYNDSSLIDTSVSFATDECGQVGFNPSGGTNSLMAPLYSNVLLLDADDIKATSRIEINSDNKTLRELVKVVQDTKLAEIVGNDLYYDILAIVYNYVNNGVVINESVNTLLFHIKEWLKYQVVADFIQVNHYKMTNKGSFKLNDDNATAATNQEIEWYRTFYDNTAASYKEKLINYMKKNNILDARTDRSFDFRGVYLDSKDSCGTSNISVASVAGGGSGAFGSQGPKGDVGATGPQGMIGYQGFQGEIGPEGDLGATGPQGLIGYQGFQGNQGLVGNQGIIGATGSQGLIGYQGSQGNQGLRGFQGLQGQMGMLDWTPVMSGGWTYSTNLNSFARTSNGATAWGKMYSQEAYYGGLYISFRAKKPTGNGQIYVGMERNPQTLPDPFNIPSYVGLDFGIYLTNFTYGVYVDGGSFGIGSWSETDVFTLHWNGAEVRMYRNNVPMYNAGVYPFTGTYSHFIAFGYSTDSEIMDVVYTNSASIGARGLQGFQGPVGFQGFQGTGVQGGIGATGIQGPQGLIGLQGSQGQAGPQGNQGFTGLQGNQGIVGSQGNQGLEGSQGNQGFQGNQGLEGSQGNQGFQGNQGLEGSQGSQGFQGESGPQGNQGIEGSQGFQGEKGDTGSQGFQGAAGPQGNQGIEGSQGLQGSIGMQGNQGQVGSQGNQGNMGLQGFQGNQGQIGYQGVQGNIGLQGYQGYQGDKGQDGILSGQTYYFNQSVSSDVTGYKVLSTIPTANGQVTATFSLSGNQQSYLAASYMTPMLGFAVIPAGTQRFFIHYTKEAQNNLVNAYLELNLADEFGNIKGPTLSSNVAAIGWVGSGIPAETILEITLPTTAISVTDRMIVRLYLNNNDSTIRNIVYTTEGTSYYSFVITSVGAQGLEGAQGPQGFQGSIGDTGAQGPQGNQGQIGFQGNQGNQGIQGITGLQGNQGNQGIQGITGFQGSQGNQGIQGITGFQGNQGNIGFQGNQGNVGVQGIQGIQGITGFQGNQGNQGIQGITGFQGNQGFQGIQGVVGFQGNQGNIGFQGNQGNQGFRGFQGNVGVTEKANLARWMYNSSTGNPGSGYFRMNTTLVSNVTSIKVHFTAFFPNNDFSEILSIANKNTWIVFRDRVNPDVNYGYFQLSQNVTIESTFVEFVGTMVTYGTFESGGYWFDGNDFYVYFETAGAQGTTGPRGFQGFQGVQGITGFQGNQGNVGAQGIQGITGFQGNQGNVGAQGTIGFQGFQGNQGNVGAQGTQGIQGITGFQGNQGNVGAQGTIGFQGNQGNVGAQGIQGITGFQGNQGNVGAQGTIGFQGNQGNVGAQGTQGIQGITGVRGGSDWTPIMTNVTRSSTDSMTFTKTGGFDMSWDSQVYSQQGYVRGVYMSTRVSSTTGSCMIGLNTDPSTNASFTGIDYAFYLTEGNVEIYESGTYIGAAGTFTTNTTFYIVYDGYNVRYYKDGTLSRTVARSIGSALYLDSSIYTSNYSFNNLVFGPMGEAGAQGIQGTTGFQGFQGNVGAQGTTGAQGTIGFQGNVGAQGTQGIQGITGFQGNQGNVGLQGTQGIMGFQGFQGNVGAQGTTGQTGAQGITGFQGFQGNVGAQGTTGQTGVQGTTGFQGFQGNVGAQGTQGIQGIRGFQGFQGNVGAQGTTGQTGAQGTTGFQGFQGNVGAQGTTGQTGAQGTTGFQGNQGNVGAQGIQGITGFQGFQGNVGSQGTQGITGFQGFQGNVGSQGTQGITGFQGFQGNVGSQGTTGFQGAQGTAGTNGLNGNQGFQGPQGLQGITGTTGLNGNQGFQGFQGLQGITGTTGLNGNQGFQGFQGLQGITGTTGLNGNQGFQGLQGWQGVAGVGTQGNQGPSGAGGSISFNRQAASYTLVLSDAGKVVEMNVSTANNLTIPLNSSVAFAVGTEITITQYGAGRTTIVATSGVTLRSVNSWLKANGQYSFIGLLKVSTDEWYVYGDVSP